MIRKGDVLTWLDRHLGWISRLDDGRLEAYLWNKLLKEYWRGYPLENLSIMLRSDNERMVKNGVQLAWELKQDAKPVLNDLVVLLSHRLPYVRGHVAQCVLWCAGSHRGGAIGRAVSLIDDPDPRVRWSVKVALMFPKREPLLAGARHLDDKALAQLFRDLPAHGWRVAHPITTAERQQRMAAMKAAHLALDGDSSSLRRMAEEGSSEEKGFAEWYLRLLELRPPEVA